MQNIQQTKSNHHQTFKLRKKKKTANCGSFIVSFAHGNTINQKQHKTLLEFQTKCNKVLILANKKTKESRQTYHKNQIETKQTITEQQPQKLITTKQHNVIKQKQKKNTNLLKSDIDRFA